MVSIAKLGQSFFSAAVVLEAPKFLDTILTPICFSKPSVLLHKLSPRRFVFQVLPRSVLLKGNPSAVNFGAVRLIYIHIYIYIDR